MPKYNGGQAFPQTHEALNVKGCEGMSLRDYFAGQAIIGLCSRERFQDDMKEHKSADYVVDQLANDGFKVADAMIKAREL